MDIEWNTQLKRIISNGKFEEEEEGERSMLVWVTYTIFDTTNIRIIVFPPFFFFFPLENSFSIDDGQKNNNNT